MENFRLNRKPKSKSKHESFKYETAELVELDI